VNKPKAVAWIHFFKNGGFQITPTKKYPKDFPLYFAQPQREWQGLTDEEIDQVAASFGYGYIDVARAIESKLKEKNT